MVCQPANQLVDTRARDVPWGETRDSPQDSLVGGNFVVFLRGLSVEVRPEALSLGVEIKTSLTQGSQTWLLTQSMLRDSAAINPTLTTHQTMQLLFQC